MKKTIDPLTALGLTLPERRRLEKYAKAARMTPIAWAREHLREGLRELDRRLGAVGSSE